MRYERISLKMVILLCLRYEFILSRKPLSLLRQSPTVFITKVLVNRQPLLGNLKLSL